MVLKIEDLAIGDWVQAVTYILDGEERLTPPAYVSAIDQSGSVYLMFDPEGGDPDEYDIEAIRPIPLSAEILTKNGFERNSPNSWAIGSINDANPHLCVIDDEENGFCAAAQNELCVILNPTPHVHCLQHVMRMIGIDRDIWL